MRELFWEIVIGIAVVFAFVCVGFYFFGPTADEAEEQARIEALPVCERLAASGLAEKGLLRRAAKFAEFAARRCEPALLDKKP